MRIGKPAAALALALLTASSAEAASRRDTHAVQKPLPLVELRQYVLYPGKRDVLIDMFERYFVESQDAVGMKIIGTFREPEHPSHFTWLRGFTDMDVRAKGLNDFYFGPVWVAHKADANPLLEDNDNVLLLREAYPGSGFPVAKAERAPVGTTTLPGGFVVVNIYYLKEPPRSGFTDFFKSDIAPQLKQAGIDVLASFVPEESANNFPKLKVREGENLFVWFARYKDEADYESHLAALKSDPMWRDQVSAALSARLGSPPEVLKLEPTARSLLH